MRPGTLFIEYSENLTATGSNPIEWELTARTSLPDGLTLSKDGIISGTPTEEGNFFFTVKASNTVGSDDLTLSISISPDIVPPTIITTSLAGGVVGTAYNKSLEATGSSPILWTRVQGTLPDGLFLAESGIISGTPTVIGTFNFTVRAENDITKDFDETALEIIIAAAPVAPAITTAALPDGIVGENYTQKLGAAGSAPITWSVGSGSLPGGVTLDPATGIISGTPAAQGTFNFIVIASNAADIAVQGLSITVVPAPVAPVITTTALPDGVLLAAYNQNLTAEGTAPIEWTYTGALPNGLTLSRSGNISGTPTVPGIFSFTVQAVNTAGSATQPLSITVAAAPPTIITASLAGGVVGTAYTKTLEATGTKPIYWTLSQGSLPNGLNLAVATGIISGTPTTVGTFNFTVRAENLWDFDETVLSIEITPAPVAPAIMTTALPDGIVGINYTQKPGVTGTAPITWTRTAGELPGGLTLESSSGIISGSPTTSGTFNFTLQASNGAGNATQPLSLTIVPTPVAPAITTATLPDGVLGAMYSHTLTATGTAPIEWECITGFLPGGLTLSRSGNISGMLITHGTFNFTVQASNTADSDTQPLSITVSAVPPTILTTSLAGGVAGTAYNKTLEASGTQPVTWSRTAGSLPDGLSLAANGVISGTPTVVGTFNFTVQAENSGGVDETALAITIANAPVAPAITTVSFPDGTVGTSYTQKLGAAGTAPITWIVVGGSLPGGLSLDTTTGTISGTPTTQGLFDFTVRAENSVGSAEQDFSITIVPAPIAPTITTTTLPDGVLGSAYNQNLAATGTAPIEWERVSGDLPDGVTLSRSGNISGTPTALGTFNFTVSASNVVDSVTKGLSIEVSRVPPTIITESLAGGTVGAAYDKTLAATGTAPITWSIVNGALPGGLSLAPATGRITGTPNAEGVFTFTVRAENSGGSDEKALPIEITPAPVAPEITTTSLPNGTVGWEYNQKLAATGTAPFTWWVSTGSLPGGLTLDPSTGIISGTPTTTGAFYFTIRVINAANGHSRPLSITIVPTPVPPSITTDATLPNAAMGKYYYFNLEASGTAPIDWELATDQSLPAGLTLSRNGTISGFPEGPVGGPFTFNIKVSNAAPSPNPEDVTQRIFALYVGYEIIFNSNGGTPEPTMWVFSSTTPITLPEPTNNAPFATAGGHTGGRFRGWFTQNNPSSAIEPVPSPLTVTQSYTLYADWGYRIREPGPAGGIIVYRNTAGFQKTGFQTIPTRTDYYLELAPADASVPGGGVGADRFNWSSTAASGNTRLDVSYYDIGRGGSNTASILIHDANAPAASIARNYGSGTAFDDWFLPTFYELLEVFSALHGTTYIEALDSEYWSSSESPAQGYQNRASVVSFLPLSNMVERYKHDDNLASRPKVRAMRSF